MINLGCCCGFTCTIATSLFNDSTGFSTTGSVAGGLLTLDAGEVMTFTATAATANDGQHLVSLAVDTADATATVRLVCARTDDSNYLFGEFAIAAGAGTIRCGVRSGGSDSYLADAETIPDTGANLTDPHELALCWEPGDEQTPEELSTGPMLPTTIAGTSWVDPDNALLDDGNTTLYSMGGAPPVTSTTLGATFSVPVIPPRSTIDGYRAEFEGGHDGSSTDVVVNCTLDVGVDTQTKGPTAVSSGSNNYTFGSDTDDWGFGHTAEDVNGKVVSVGVAFTDNDSGTAQITVDVIKLQIWYTTPDRTQGLLRFSIKKNSDGLYQCTKAQTFSEGLSAGARSQVGTWTFTDLTYSYIASPTRPTCPDCTCQPVADGEPCTACCAAGFPPALEYVIDLGAGGWTADDCSSCSGISGQYTLLQQYGYVGGVYIYCYWSYSEPFSCTCDQTTIGALEINLELIDDGATCKWRVSVGFLGLRDPTSTCVGAEAVYESAAMATDEDCQDMPVTLNKVSDTPGDMCNGSLPASITIDLP